MELYIMRHGQSCMNTKDIVQGRSQTPLSDTGKAQVEAVSLKVKDVNFDIVFTSPLKRTVMTANIVNKFHGAKIIKDERLTEIDKGVFTGVKKAKISLEDDKKRRARPQEYGCESYENVAKRCKEFYNYIIKEYKDKCVLVVTHGVICECLVKLAHGESFGGKDVKIDYSFKNAEVRKITI